MPEPPFQPTLLCHLIIFFLIPFPTLFVIYLHYSLFLHLPSFLPFAPSLIDQVYTPSHAATFPSHQIPIFAGMERKGIKREISGADAD